MAPAFVAGGGVVADLARDKPVSLFRLGERLRSLRRRNVDAVPGPEVGPQFRLLSQIELRVPRGRLRDRGCGEKRAQDRGEDQAHKAPPDVEPILRVSPADAYRLTERIVDL